MSSPDILFGITKLSSPPTNNLRNCQEIYRRTPKTVRYGTETISFWLGKFEKYFPKI